MLSDQQAQIPPGEPCGECLVVLLDRQPGMDADLADDPPEKLPHVRGKLALVDDLRDSVPIAVRGDRRDHARGSKPDTEQSALPLGDDLELDRRLVEPRLKFLELA